MLSRFLSLLAGNSNNASVAGLRVGDDDGRRFEDLPRPIVRPVETRDVRGHLSVVGHGGGELCRASGEIGEDDPGAAEPAARRRRSQHHQPDRSKVSPLFPGNKSVQESVVKISQRLFSGDDLP